MSSTMPVRPVTAGAASAFGSRRRIIAWIGGILVACVGITFGALNVFDRGPQRNIPSLGDIDRFVFVPSREKPEVTLIDSKTDRVVYRIPLSSVPSRVLVSDAVGALVASFADRSTLQIVDLSGSKSSATLDLTISPDTTVLSPDGYLVAAADGSSGSVAVASLQNRKLLFRLSGLGDSRNLTFSSDGSQLYITDRKTSELLVVDIVQQSVVGRATLAESGELNTKRARNGIDGIGVSALTRSPDGRYGFVSLGALDLLVVVDLSTQKPVKRIRLGRSPSRPYGTADGRLMLVANEGDQTVSLIDTTTLEVAATLPGARDVAAVNTGWFESLAFVMSPSQQRVVVLDLMKFEKISDIELSGTPGAGVVTSNAQKLYVPLEDTGKVAVIDTQTHRMLASIDDVGRRPWGVAMARTNNYCH